VFVGCYMTGHVYDDIAPKLTDRFRVYAVTRRGIGASDRPSTGYDPTRRAADILDVISALSMDKPILIGNSCGGDILHTIGARHADRVGGLVYLDAAEDPTLTGADYEQIPVDSANLPEGKVSSVPVKFPEAELLQPPLDPVIRKATVEDHRVKPDYARIAVPALVIFRTYPWEQALKDFPPKNDLQRAALVQGYASKSAMGARWKRDVSAIPNVRIVELPLANLFMFLSNEADVIREVRAFAATLR
jgi:non-heme chloroperoxidase